MSSISHSASLQSVGRSEAWASHDAAADESRGGCGLRLGRGRLENLGLPFGEQAPDAGTVEPGEEPACRLGPLAAPCAAHREHELVTAPPHRKGCEHLRGLRELIGLLGRQHERDRLPVVGELCFDRAPLLNELHRRISIMTPVISVDGKRPTDARASRDVPRCDSRRATANAVAVA